MLLYVYNHGGAGAGVALAIGIEGVRQRCGNIIYWQNLYTFCSVLNSLLHLLLPFFFTFFPPLFFFLCKFLSRYKLAAGMAWPWMLCLILVQNTHRALRNLTRA